MLAIRRKDFMHDTMLVNEIRIAGGRGEWQDCKSRALKPRITARQCSDVAVGNGDDMIGGLQRECFQVASHHLVQPILPPAARRIVTRVKGGVAVPGILKVEDDLAAEAPLPQSAQHKASEYRGREENRIVTRRPRQADSAEIQP